MSQKVALKTSLGETFKSILVSASTLSIAGFALAFTSSNPAVSEIGLLLGNGTIFSVVMVVFMLPILLTIFDRAIGTFTHKANFYKGPERACPSSTPSAFAADSSRRTRLISTHSALDGNTLSVARSVERARHLTDAASGSSLHTLSAGLTDMADGIEASLADMDLSALHELIDGLKALNSNYRSFDAGLVQYVEGVDAAASGYQQLHSGLTSLSSGLREAAAGTQQLQSGTTQLDEAMGNLPEEMQTQIDELMSDYTASDFEPISFVSPKNKGVTLVQFLITTSALALPSDPVAEVPEEESSSPWNQFLKLFR